MGHAIHRKGDQYRMWSSYTDTYLTDPMTREEMAKWVKDDAIQTLLERIDRETEERLARADRTGSSGFARSTEEWNQEHCGHCGGMHHLFVFRALDGNCGFCGEPKEDPAHKPTCETP